jgi:hypothetical protein
MAATSEEGEDIQQDLQEDCRAGDRKANSRFFNWAKRSECLDSVEEVSCLQNERKDFRSTALRTKMIVVHLDQLVPCQGIARNERP